MIIREIISDTSVIVEGTGGDHWKNMWSTRGQSQTLWMTGDPQPSGHQNTTFPNNRRGGGGHAMRTNGILSFI